MEIEIRDLTGEWDYATLPDSIRIGEDCYLEHRGSFERMRSLRNPGLLLGDRVQVYTWSAFSVEPDGVIEIGGDSTLAGAVFWCAGKVTIGKRVVLSYNVVIADSDFHPRDPELRRLDAIAVSPHGDRLRRPPSVVEPVVIEDDVVVGVGAIILKGVRIGAGASVCAGSVVTSDVPAGSTVAGNPARVVTQGGQR
jgi:acetyltransferase-like isoleucine patch superfamily enzyme